MCPGAVLDSGVVVEVTRQKDIGVAHRRVCVGLVFPPTPYLRMRQSVRITAPGLVSVDDAEDCASEVNGERHGVLWDHEFDVTVSVGVLS